MPNSKLNNEFMPVQSSLFINTLSTLSNEMSLTLNEKKVKERKSTHKHSNSFSFQLPIFARRRKKSV